MRKFAHILIGSTACAAAIMLLVAAAAPKYNTTTDLVVRNGTDTPGLKIYKTGAQTANLIEAYTPGGTLVHQVPADGILEPAYGGTGAALTDPNADRILFWDDSAGVYTHLTVGTALAITTTTLAVSTVPVANGGTGSTTAAAAKTALGIQSGSVTTAADGTVTNTFSTAFSSAPVVVISQIGDAVTVTNNLVSVTASNFVFSAGSDARVAKWIAVGAP